MQYKTYSELMSEGSIHLILRIDAKQPIELSAFVGAFTSLSNEFDRHIKDSNPDLKSDAKIFVREIRQGSIEADMFPALTVLAGVISQMDQMIIVEEFVRLWGRRLSELIASKNGAPNSKSELKDWANATEAMANDPDGTSTLEAAYFEDGKKQIKAAYKFTSIDARKAQSHIEEKKAELDKKSNADHERVLMVFTRSDINSVDVGKRSGEMVKVEAVNTKSLPLKYGSSLAEERIKHEIREADDNIFKKGFSVDVNVELINNKPAVYSVTNVHQVFDLPEDS